MLPTYSSSPNGDGRSGTVMKCSPERTVRIRRKTLLLLLGKGVYRAWAKIGWVEEKRIRKTAKRRCGTDMVMGFGGERELWDGMAGWLLGLLG